MKDLNKLFERKDLSLKAKGIVLVIITLGKEEFFNLSDLIKTSKDGRDSIISGIKELKKCGLVKDVMIRDVLGQINIKGYELLKEVL